MDWIEQHRTLVTIEGVIFILLGFLAVFLPGLSTLSTELFIGWLLIFGGAVQCYRTIKAGLHSTGFIGSILMSILSLVFGVLLILFPAAGVISLTLLLMIFFIAEGIAKIVFGIQLRHTRTWGWFIFNGILALIMGFIIWAGWPGTAFWVLGLLVGINMIFFGATLIFLALGGPPKINASSE